MYTYSKFHCVIATKTTGILFVMLGRLLHSCPTESPRCVGATSARAAVRETSSAMPDPSYKQLHVLWLFPRWPVYVVMIC